MASDVHKLLRADSDSSEMNQQQMQHGLHSMFHQMGVAGQLKANLRTMVLSNLHRGSLAAKQGQAHVVPEEVAPPPLLMRAVDSLILEHLKLSGYHFSEHVFSGESSVQHGALRMADTLKVLRLRSLSDDADGPGLQNVYLANEPMEISTGTPLLHVMTTLASLVTTTQQKTYQVESKGMQADSREVPSIDARLRSIDEEYREHHRQHSKTTYTAEEMMKRYQEEIDRRAADEIRTEIERLKRAEIAQMRMEEAARHNRDFQDKVAEMKLREKELEHNLNMQRIALEQKEHQLELKARNFDVERAQLEQKLKAQREAAVGAQAQLKDMMERSRKLEQQVSLLELDLQNCQEQRDALLAREVKRNDEEKLKHLVQEEEFAKRQQEMQEWLERRQRQQDEFHTKVVETQLQLERERDRLHIEWTRKEDLLRQQLKEELNVERERTKAKLELEAAQWRREAEAAYQQRQQQLNQREEQLRQSVADSRLQLEREKLALLQRQQCDEASEPVPKRHRDIDAEAVRREGDPNKRGKPRGQNPGPGDAGDALRRVRREQKQQLAARAAHFEERRARHQAEQKAVQPPSPARDDSIIRSCRDLVQNNRVLLASGLDTIAPAVGSASGSGLSLSGNLRGSHTREGAWPSQGYGGHRDADRSVMQGHSHGCAGVMQDVDSETSWSPLDLPAQAADAAAAGGRRPRGSPDRPSTGSSSGRREDPEPLHMAPRRRPGPQGCEAQEEAAAAGRVREAELQVEPQEAERREGGEQRRGEAAKLRGQEEARVRVVEEEGAVREGLEGVQEAAEAELREREAQDRRQVLEAEKRRLAQEEGEERRRKEEERRQEEEARQQEQKRREEEEQRREEEERRREEEERRREEEERRREEEERRREEEERRREEEERRREEERHDECRQKLQALENEETERRQRVEQGGAEELGEGLTSVAKSWEGLQEGQRRLIVDDEEYHWRDILEAEEGSLNAFEKAAREARRKRLEKEAEEAKYRAPTPEPLDDFDDAIIPSDRSDSDVDHYKKSSGSDSAW